MDSNTDNSEELRLFTAWITQDNKAAELEAAEKHRATAAANEIAIAKTAAQEAKQAIEAYMAENGLLEFKVSGAQIDYKIGYSTPRESVKVVDPEAVPEDFVKIERKPMLTMIGAHIKELLADGKSIPNWAVIEKGTPKLEWKTVKKG